MSNLSLTLGYITDTRITVILLSFFEDIDMTLSRKTPVTRPLLNLPQMIKTPSEKLRKKAGLVCLLPGYRRSDDRPVTIRRVGGLASCLRVIKKCFTH